MKNISFNIIADNWGFILFIGPWIAVLYSAVYRSRIQYTKDGVMFPSLDFYSRAVDKTNFCHRRHRKGLCIFCAFRGKQIKWYSYSVFKKTRVPR
jgi:hypothetical protein